MTTVTILDGVSTDRAKRLGQRVERAREARGWDKATLARRAAVSPSYVGRLEDGVYDNPSVTKMAAIADALGIPLIELAEPVPATIAEGIETELHAMFPPERAAVVADILRVLSRHDARTQWYILGTMKPLVTGHPGRNQ